MNTAKYANTSPAYTVVPNDYHQKPQAQTVQSRLRSTNYKTISDETLANLKKDYESKLNDTMAKYRENMKKHTENKRMLKTLP